MATPQRNFRITDDVWETVGDALKSQSGARRVTVTIRPGMTISGAILAFLRAYLEAVGR